MYFGNPAGFASDKGDKSDKGEPLAEIFQKEKLFQEENNKIFNSLCP